MNGQTKYCFVALFLSGVFCASAALGDAARDAYDKGVDLFEQEAFRESATAFREAIKLKPTWKIYYNIGQAEAAARRYGLALDAFETYLVEGGDEIDDSRREAVIKEIKSFRYLVGTVEVEAPAGLKLFIDDELRATVPLSSVLRVAVGKHRIVLKDNDDIIFDKMMRIVGEETTVIRSDDPGEEPIDTDKSGVDLGGEAGGDGAGGDEKDNASTLSNKTLFGIVIGGVGLAVTIGGIPLFAIGRDYFDKSEKESDLDDHLKWKKEYERYNKLGIALFVSGGVLLTAGTVLLVLGLREQKKASGVSRRFELTPSFNGLTVDF